MSSVGSKQSGSRAQRVAENQQRARRNQMKRRLVQFGVVVVLAVAVGIGAAWWMSGDDDGTPEVSAAQALYSFDTADFHSLAFEPGDPETLYFGHHYGLKMSDDAGKSWTDTALSDVDVMQQSIPVDSNGRRYAAGHDVFQVSTDDGESWNAQATNMPSLDIHGFAAAPGDANRLYAFEVRSASFYTSEDGGETWDTLRNPPGMETVNLPLAVAYDDPQHVFAAVGQDILESTDGGQSWENLGGPGDTILSIATHPEDSARMLVGGVNGLWERTAENAWNQLPLSPEGSILAIAIHADMPDRIAAIDQQGNLYRSDDYGQEWITP